MQRHNEWLRLARQDIAFARLGLHSGDDEVLAPAIYHTQQAAEKALKAYLAFRAMGIPKIHDLLKLIKLCSQFDQRFHTLDLHAAGLNVYSTSTRYPDDLWALPDFEMLKTAIEQAGMIIDFVVKLIQE